jgi:hypothetical protein
MKDKESDSSYSSVPPDDLEELVSGDDAVIGQALKWSAFAFVSLLVAGFVIYKFLNPGEEKIKPVNTLVEAPEQRVVSAEEYVPKVKFTDITTEAGIQFKHNNGATGDKLLPESMGSGVAFFDFDMDGDQDLLFTNGTWWPWDIKK